MSRGARAIPEARCISRRGCGDERGEEPAGGSARNAGAASSSTSGAAWGRMPTDQILALTRGEP